ncbi:MAG TPA: 3-hydroxybutyryl-CoA dehydrogenase [Cyanobacteria bacterium UBA8530]|nr:3-hydroxybutyryl-CoA dehydrogenase [Cyanobacteria bacterium UBA8530]
MELNEIKKIAVLGAGQMGAGIAQVAAQAGYSVVLYDIQDAVLERAHGGLKKNFLKLVAKGKMNEQEAEEVMKKIKTASLISELADCDLVVEAIVENLEIKRSLWSQIDQACAPDAIFASNTSSLAITQLASLVSHPERFIGMHFMNPVPYMQLVEIIDGLATDAKTHETVMEIARKMGKTPVEVNDAPGFVANRLLIPMLNEAFFVLHEGVATPEAIDQVMKLGMNHPMGPLALADLIGLDTVLSIMEVLHHDLGDPKYRPCPLLRKYVQAGRLGKKSGLGVYSYEGAK